jgi:hypothetical protein
MPVCSSRRKKVRFTEVSAPDSTKERRSRSSDCSPPQTIDLPRHRIPAFADAAPGARRRISFVTVAFSDELEHNLLRSPCVQDPANELIVVDNRENLFFDTLSAAWRSGCARARHPLLVLVHEDVLLLRPWQAALEAALDALERHDPAWGLIGVAGWCDNGLMAGHWSDPSGCFDKLQGQPFDRVARIDEHLMVLRRDVGFTLDPALPSIHQIGNDLSLTSRAAGRSVYVINAPTVHKAADAHGRPIESALDSPKIQARSTLTYIADKSCSDDYAEHKWARSDAIDDEASSRCSSADTQDRAPVLLLARGGGGSRLLALAAQDAGLSIGNDLNGAGDALELVPAIYKVVLARLRYASAELEPRYSRELVVAVRSMRERAGDANPWGFKLPESMLIPDVLLTIFPDARFVHMLRDPLATCLRRTHMTARYDNQIGQAALLAAYRWYGLDADAILDESPAMRMARTTEHQIRGARAVLQSLPAGRVLELRFEHLVDHPQRELERLRGWLDPADRTAGTDGAVSRLAGEIDPRRASHPQQQFAPEVQSAVAAHLLALRTELGYCND